MKRHRFEPGKLVAGLVVLGVALTYGVDATGEWNVDPFVLLPIVPGGLCLAGIVSLIMYRSRKRRALRAEEKP